MKTRVSIQAVPSKSIHGKVHTVAGTTLQRGGSSSVDGSGKAPIFYAVQQASGSFVGF